MENDSTTKFLADVSIHLRYDDLLQRADEDDYAKFIGAIACIFDMNPLLVAHISNLDYLWRPEIKSPVNYIQWITLEPNGRDVIREVLCYLFFDCDPEYEEPYEFSNDQLELRSCHINKILTDHGTLDSYFEFVSLRLWKTKNFMKENYGCYTIKL